MYNYDDFLIENIINGIILEEEGKIYENIMLLESKNIKKIIGGVLNKLGKVKSFFKRKRILILLFIAYISTVGMGNINLDELSYTNLESFLINNDKIEELAKQDEVVEQEVINSFKHVVDSLKEKQKILIKREKMLKDPLTLNISEKGKDFIKEHEKLKLKAYNIGDGMITIGYGHAQPKDNSKYKVGDEITKKEADKIFEEDIKKFERGVKRLFKKWKREGKDIKVTQHMFDAMVSMAYNMGVSGLLKTEFVDELLKGDYEKASEKILSSRVSDNFHGLKKRRIKEKNLFLKEFV